MMPLRGTSFGWKKLPIFHVSSLEPLPQNLAIRRYMTHEPVMADVVEAAFDVAFENPLRGRLLGQRREALFDGVRCGPFRSEPERASVRCGLGHGFESKQA